MNVIKLYKESFSVIGKKGSEADGGGFVTELWKKANQDIREILPLAKRRGPEGLVSCWGLRSDSALNLQEWGDGGDGLYLAGVEVENDTFAPLGWSKWTVPASNYVSVQVEGKTADAIREAREYIRKKGLEITGAYFEYMNPLAPGQLQLFFPVKDKEKFVFPPLNQR